ncbi:pyridoxal phosphate-dependent transferase [Vibrio vulnificus]|uniref:pyridoxal phosphate-dependent transferase n=1 Tax=Vibrio vulnificus TaxID=672 RepID=UPI00211201DF|nr:pyridoxal phosphate-dependent transferase [Vibrio vulnificus]
MMSNTNQKTIGGEQELLSDHLHYGVTNSGRSSLRWALESMGLKHQKILVPDFICQIVIDVLIEQEVNFDFYRVNPDLSIDVNSESLLGIDAVYLVRYFGAQTVSLDNLLATLTIPFILDDVFGISKPHFDNPCHWVYFNSLRKITAIPDYSQLISNRALATVTVESLANFAQLKYQAKDLKAKYLTDGLGDEASYLASFVAAEHLLDTSQGIYQPSGRSSMLANTFYRTLDQENQHRQSNLALAKHLLPEHLYLDVVPEFPSFLPIVLKNRDAVRKQLMQHQIFLAVHWPQLSMVSNQLSDYLLSLPLDSRYSKLDIERVCNMIMEYADEC